SASSSTAQVATPVHSHPLLADDLPSRGRRSRPGTRQGQADPDSVNSQTPTYSTLKDRLGSKAQTSSNHRHANWDGSVRGYGKADRARTTRDTSAPSATRQPLPSAWDRPPTFVVGSSKDHLSASGVARTTELVEIDGLPTDVAS